MLPRLGQNHSHLIPVENYNRLENAVADALREIVGPVEASVRPASNPPGMELIDCIELPVLIIDRDLTVAGFNTAAARLLSLSDVDYGRHLHCLQKPAGTQQMEELCEHVIASGSSHRVEVADGAGSRFSVNIGCHKAKQNISGAVLTFTNVTAFRESLERAIEEREFTKVVLNTIADGLAIVDSDLRIQTANQAFYALFQTSRQESQGAHLYDVGSGDWNIPRLRALLVGKSSSNEGPQSLEYDHEFPGVGRRTLWLNARPLTRGTHSELTLPNANAQWKPCAKARKNCASTIAWALP
jgi:two-component system CheB/CheR fusion protein